MYVYEESVHLANIIIYCIILFALILFLAYVAMYQGGSQDEEEDDSKDNLRW